MNMFMTIRQSFEQFLKEVFAVLPEMLDQSRGEHREIYEALKDRKRECAVAAMSRHLSRVQKGIERYYANEKAGKAEGSGPLRRRALTHSLYGKGPP
jgi:DNA-binding GntR family transcriptional regulator